MSARTAGRRRHEEPAEFYEPEGDPAADGLFVRLIARVIENPAMSGGLLVMVLTAAAVVSNALFLQRAHHPEPWFATRPAVALAPDGGVVSVPDPRPRAEAPATPPLPRVQPDSAPVAAAPAVSQELVAHLQRALGARGLYAGKVDGIPGARTQAAISAYEKAQGLPVIGAPTEAILAHMAAAPVVAASAPATAVPAAPAEAVAATPEPPAPVPATVLETVAAESSAAPASELLSYPPKAPPPAAAAAAEPEPALVTRASAPAADTAPAPPPAPSASGDIGARRTLSVQKALNMIGYGPVPEDGVADQETIAAIRRFELDNGLPITGAAGDTLIQRLVAIGAMEAA